MFKPTYEISNKLLQNLKKITEINTEFKMINISDVLYSEMKENTMALSTFSSTSIGGNPLPLSEVKKIFLEQPKHLRESEIEILNYKNTLKYIAPFLEKNTISLDMKFVQNIHKLIMKELTESHNTGKWRKEPGYLNNPVSDLQIYLPPDHKDVPGLIEELVNFIKQEKERIDPIVIAGLFHKQFHIIFPFTDGNGRTARLLTMALLCNSEINRLPLYSFDNYYNKNIPKYFKMIGISGNYYEMIKKVKFTEWLEYFTDGIIDELLRTKKELEMNEFTPQVKMKYHHEAILVLIQKNGYTTDREYSKKVDRAKATRALDFKYLMELNLIDRKGKGKNTYYVLKR